MLISVNNVCHPYNSDTHKNLDVSLLVTPSFGARLVEDKPSLLTLLLNVFYDKDFSSFSMSNGSVQLVCKPQFFKSIQHSKFLI